MRDDADGTGLAEVADVPASAPTRTAADAADAARGLLALARAPSTQRAYNSDWRIFEAWCREADLPALPAHPATVAMFVAAQAVAGRKPSTLARRVAAIAQRHKAHEHGRPQDHPQAQVLAGVLSGAARSSGRRPSRKRAADADVTRDMLKACAGASLRAHRDRALVALGMAGAFRRSELVALRLSDLTWRDEGVDVLVRSSKADQEGAGQVVAVLDGARLSPVTHLRAWLLAAGLIGTDGTVPEGESEREVFRRISRRDQLVDTGMSDRGVALVVKQLAAVAGYDPAGFSAHSLRSGFLTAAARARASIFKMQEVSRHKSVDVLAGYVRDAERYRDHAGKDFL